MEIGADLPIWKITCTECGRTIETANQYTIREFMAVHRMIRVRTAGLCPASSGRLPVDSVRDKYTQRVVGWQRPLNLDLEEEGELGTGGR